MQGVPQSVKSKDLKHKVINAFDKVNVKVTKNDIEARHRLGDSIKMIVRFVNRKHSFVDLTSIGLEKNTHLFLLSVFYCRWNPGPCQTSGVAFIYIYIYIYIYI